MPEQNEMKVLLKTLKDCSADVVRYIGQKYIGTSPDMPLKRMAELAASSKTMHNLFQPILDEAKLANPLLKAVVEGDPEQLLKLVKKNPQYLFKKGQIKDPSNQVFYNVSAYQMMKYLCDEDMIAKVMPFFSGKGRDENYALLHDINALQKEQDQTLHHGGADLIKLSFDPTNPPDFDRILQHTVTHNASVHSPSSTFSLMENPDAILYYQDDRKKAHWYYANRETRTIEPIQPQIQTEDEAIFSQLTQSMGAMVFDSARRSNDAEHNIIAKTMNKRLVRNGIQYEQDGKRCCDTHHDFNRYYNAYRECIALHSSGFPVQGDQVWREKVGSAQKEVMWLLQRYCEENRPFIPLPDFKSSPFQRSVQINLQPDPSLEDNYEDVYRSGHFIDGLASDFVICKLGHPRARVLSSEPSPFFMLVSPYDLVAVHRLIEDAKANVIEFKLEEDLSQRPSIR